MQRCQGSPRDTSTVYSWFTWQLGESHYQGDYPRETYRQLRMVPLPGESFWAGSTCHIFVEAGSDVCRRLGEFGLFTIPSRVLANCRLTPAWMSVTAALARLVPGEGQRPGFTARLPSVAPLYLHPSRSSLPPAGKSAVRAIQTAILLQPRHMGSQWSRELRKIAPLLSDHVVPAKVIEDFVYAFGYGGHITSLLLGSSSPLAAHAAHYGSNRHSWVPFMWNSHRSVQR